jgi:hypothetical protein
MYLEVTGEPKIFRFAFCGLCFAPFEDAASSASSWARLETSVKGVLGRFDAAAAAGEETPRTTPCTFVSSLATGTSLQNSDSFEPSFSWVAKSLHQLEFTPRTIRYSSLSLCAGHNREASLSLSSFSSSPLTLALEDFFTRTSSRR